jgi:hypothetical protein
MMVTAPQAGAAASETSVIAVSSSRTVIAGLPNGQDHIAKFRQYSAAVRHGRAARKSCREITDV